MRRLTNLLPCLLVLAACGGSSNPEKDAHAAMGSGDYSTAVDYFDQALEGMDEADGKYIGLVVGKCEAINRVDKAGIQTDRLLVAGNALFASPMSP